LVNLDTMISIDNCTKIYPRGNVVAFEGLSFDVARNEIVTVVGPSGCGKTTLLRCIDGLIPLTLGSIRIGDTEVVGTDPRLAMVFQHFGLFPWQTVETNIAFGLRNQGMKRAQWRPKVREYIQQVGLEGFEKTYPYQLSGGMRQRVGLARALVMDPQVLLMDEPFASVDAQTREVLQAQFFRICEENPRTTIFITHSIEEAVVIGDRVIVLAARPGRVKEIIDVPFGRPRQLEELHSDPRVGEIRNHIWESLKQETQELTRDGGQTVP
jgi:NitT/TauT family transport system ATP-binding protein